MTPVLQVRDLTKSFRGRRGSSTVGVDAIDLDLEPGTTMAVVGESGAGKSTLGRLVLRLIDPDRGSIRFNGTDLLGLRGAKLRSARREIQAIFQNPFGSFDPLYTLAESITEPLRVHERLRRADRRVRAMELLDRVGLPETTLDRRPHEVSGGQLQRCAIARALALRPAVVVCDEALASLDLSTQAQVVNLLLDLQDQLGTSYLFISHDVALVRAISDSVVVMHQGRIVEQGLAAEVLANPRHSYTQALLDAVPVADPIVQRRRLDSRTASEDPTAPGLDASLGTLDPVLGARDTRRDDSPRPEWSTPQ